MGWCGGPGRIRSGREIGVAAPNRDALFIGGAVDTVAKVLLLYRGNPESLVLPRAWFARSGMARPNAAKIEAIDYGQTVRLGGFEAATRAISYEFDPDAGRSRRRAGHSAGDT